MFYTFTSYKHVLTWCQCVFFCTSIFQGEELSRILLAYLPGLSSTVLSEAFHLCDWDHSGWSLDSKSFSRDQNEHLDSAALYFLCFPSLAKFIFCRLEVLLFQLEVQRWWRINIEEFVTALRREAEKFALGNILNWRKSNEISLSLIRRVFASDKSNRPAVASGVSQTPTQKFVDETEDECGGWKLGKDQVQCG